MSDQLWAAVFAGFILLVRVGGAIHQTGMLRAKNSVSGLVRNLADLCIAALVFWAVGAAIFLAPQGQVIGLNTACLLNCPANLAGTELVALAAMLLATAIVGGVMAERSRFWPVTLMSVILAGLVVPLSAYWARVGWLNRLGFHDLAGAGFIHVAGAVCAAVGAIYVGPRMGKYNRDGSCNGIPGHSVPLAAVGILIMLAGWVPYVLSFVPFSIVEQRGASIALNVLLSGAGGGLAALIFCQWRYGKPDVQLTFAGMMGGLVAITAGADCLSNASALVVGLAAGVLVPVGTIAIELFWKIDDPASGIATHGLAGAWGLLAAGLLGGGTFFHRLKLLGVQMVGVLAIGVLAAAFSIALFAVLKANGRLRAKEADEFDGLDLAEHDIGAYPDFQQNSIKSYHLREA